MPRDNYSKFDNPRFTSETIGTSFDGTLACFNEPQDTLSAAYGVGNTAPDSAVGARETNLNSFPAIATGVDTSSTGVDNIVFKWTEPASDSLTQSGTCVDYWTSWGTVPRTESNFWSDGVGLASGVARGAIRTGSATGLTANTVYYFAVKPLNACNNLGVISANTCACTRVSAAVMGTHLCPSGPGQ